MLSKGKLELLVGILSNESATFEEGFKRFTQHFLKAEYFSIGWTLQHMIRQNVLRLLRTFFRCSTLDSA